jgi:hypothetical protein
MSLVTPKTAAEQDLLFNKWSYETCLLGVQVRPKQCNKV